MNTQNNDPLAQFGLDAIDLRWTLMDIASNRSWIINKDHLPKPPEKRTLKPATDLSASGQKPT
jgi:hypothetical protein